jgi:hypothetical protein
VLPLLSYSLLQLNAQRALCIVCPLVSFLGTYGWFQTIHKQQLISKCRPCTCMADTGGLVGLPSTTRQQLSASGPSTISSFDGGSIQYGRTAAGR